MMVRELRVDITNKDDLIEFAMAIRQNPVGMTYELFGVKLWRWDGPDGCKGQAEFMESCFENVRTVAPSGHKTGKTAACCILPALWILSHPYSYFAVSAGSWTAVEKRIFPGLRSYVRMQPHIFPNTDNVLDSGWRLDDNWEVIGFSVNKKENIQGWHSKGYPQIPELNKLKGTCIMVDEASSLEKEIHDSIDSMVDGENHYVMPGNPLRSSGAMVACIHNPDWTTIRMSSWDTPVARETPDAYEYVGLASKSWCEAKKREYGENSGDYKARVLGLVPSQSDMAFFSRDDIIECGKREPIPWQEDGDLVAGVDVGRSKVGDPSVIIVRGETTIHYCKGYRGLEQPELIEWMQRVYARFGKKIKMFYVDGTGIGSGVPATIVRNHSIPATPVVNAARAHDAIKYGNCRAECFDNLRLALKYLCIPEEIDGERALEHLLELAEIEKSATGKQRIMLEDKDLTKARVGHSPDYADALAMTFFRRVGNPAFAMASFRHKMGRKPTVYESDKKWNLHIDGFSSAQDRSGKLCRAAWLSRSDESACLWAHVDIDGCWTIFDSLVERNVPARAFWQKVTNVSSGHRYMYDVASAPQNRQKDEEYHVRELINEVTQLSKQKHYTDWVEAKDVSGMLGLDMLDHLLLSTMARYPEDQYWIDHPALDPAASMDKAMLVVWPDNVLQALQEARLKQPPMNQTDDQEDRPEGLIADGGSIVRCLRLLMVAAGGW